MFGGWFGRSQSAEDVIDHDSMVEVVKAKTHALIDVRERREFEMGHIEGAVNVPLSAFDMSKVATDKPVVVYCLTGARSGVAANMLRSAGHQNVRNYRPGVAGWRLQGGRLV